MQTRNHHPADQAMSTRASANAPSPALGGSRRSLRWMSAAGVVALLIGACGPLGDGPSIDDAADDTTQDAGDDGTQDTPEEVPSDDEEPATDDGAAPDDTDADADAGASRLAAAMDAYEVIYQDDPDAFDGRCAQLADWSEFRAAASDLPEAGLFDDGGFERIMDELHSFGCSVGAVRTEGFGYPAAIVSVRRAATDEIAELDATATPGGLDVFVGTAEVGDLPFYTDAPVSVAILAFDEFELHVTAPPEVLEPDELLPLLDAAWQDLAALA